MPTLIHRFATAAFAASLMLPVAAAAHGDECPDGHEDDGYECVMVKGAGKTGGHFRATFPSHWDGDLVIINHGFDLNDRKIRPHGTCSHDASVSCEEDADCGASPRFCNEISYLGLDEVLLPMGKAVAANTYSASGWAVFASAKDLKEMIAFVKKHPTFRNGLKRVIVTGFSLGGAVTADATLKLKIDGAVPLCGAVGGGLPTWDLAQDVRLVYDFLCDNVPGAKFQSAPDFGVANTNNPDADATAMAIRVDACFGNLGIVADDGFQDQRRADFIAITGFTGGEGFNMASAMGFATLGLGDFVQDPKRLKNKRIGLNDTLDYTALGGDPLLAADFDVAVKRMTKGPGRSKLRKASWPDFTKGKGKKADFPILSIGGAGDWLVIPEFQKIYEKALVDGGKQDNFSLVWQDAYGHCVFSPEEMQATFTKFFEWLGPVGGPRGPKPDTAAVEAACVDAGGVIDDSCNFDAGFAVGALHERIPARPDWPAAALP